MVKPSLLIDKVFFTFLENPNEVPQKTNEKWTEALLTYLNTPRSEVLNLEEDASGGQTSESGPPHNQVLYSKGDALQMLEQLTTGQNMDACLNVLAQLDVTSTMEESEYVFIFEKHV